MGYTVRYGPSNNNDLKARRMRLILPIGILAVILSTVLAGRVWPEEANRLRRALFPWERQSVQQAFSGFQQDLKEGESVTDAITAFCLELLEGTDFSR